MTFSVGRQLGPSIFFKKDCDGQTLKVRNLESLNTLLSGITKMLEIWKTSLMDKTTQQYNEYF